MDKSELTDDLRGPAEIKAACFEKVSEIIDGLPSDRYRDDHGVWQTGPDPKDVACSTVVIVNAVLDTIIAHSQSPRTVGELTRIRGAVDA